ncbi:MAG: exo-beta-N-acetylmuramidase NamZ domain-containing protein, partial [Porphyromonas sp.]
MKRFLLLILLSALSVGGYAQSTKLQVGAERMELLLPLLEGKRVALMVNQSSLVGATGTHLVDTLLSRGVKVVRLFVPEHGLRGKVDAGKAVKSEIDEKTQLPVVSLYGQRRRPTPEMLEDVDLLLFDLQDVGTRFYTYISSMHYLM